LNVSISILDDNDVYVLSSPNLKRIPLGKGKYKSICTIPSDFLNKGKYFCTVLLVGNNFEIISQLDKIIAIDVNEEGTHRGEYYGYWGGVVRPYLKWENTQLDKFGE
jgi:lipopolysaccharide transport system ATP-binding protein